MKYFLHDSNAFNDEKITELFIHHGYEGLGLFYTILEKLAGQEKPIKTSVLKHQLKVGKGLEKCWNFLESIELISSNNGETFNKQLLKFSEKYQVKKEKDKLRIAEWREKQEVKENVTRNEQVGNTDKGIVSKVKVSKDINISENKFSNQSDSSQMPNPDESKKRKVAPKEKGVATPPGLTEKFVEPYDAFLRLHTGGGEKVTPGGRKALKDIIHHLLKIAADSRTNEHESDEDRAVDIWRVILERIEKWDKFHQGQLKLEQINSNIVNIMKSIKSGSNGKSINPEQLAAEAMHHHNTQGNR